MFSFVQSVYRINENMGTLQIEVIFSELFNVDISINIVNSDVSATGKININNIKINYMFLLLYTHR